MLLFIQGVLLGAGLVLAARELRSLTRRRSAKKAERFQAAVSREIQRRESIAAFDQGHEAWMEYGTTKRSVTW